MIISRKEILSAFSHLIYPELCLSCGTALNAGEKLICLECRFSLPKTDFHLIKDNPAEKIFWGRVPVQMAASYLHFEKKSGIQSILHHLKYRGKKEIGRMLGHWYGLDLKKSEIPRFDMIIPVPLHPSKFRSRGYNQSEWFGKGLSESLGIPVVTDNLVRIRKSESQTRKSRFNRWQNVSGIFAVQYPERLINRHILLVDDVITTGATLEACAQTILALNCGAKISMVTLAFAN